MKERAQPAGFEDTCGGVGASCCIDAGVGNGEAAGKLSLTSVAATVMEPASEYGRAAMDELHQQTVNLLSFQTLPREQYDAQVSFNLLPELGEAAKVKLGSDGAAHSSTVRRLGEERLPTLGVADGSGTSVSWVCSVDVGGV